MIKTHSNYNRNDLAMVLHFIHYICQLKYEGDPVDHITKFFAVCYKNNLGMENISSNHSINNPPKVCCVNCFDIKEIKDFIAANNVHGKCNYCQSNNVYIAEAEEVGRFIIEGINRRYEDAANNVGYEGEYLLPTQTISEVIFDLDVFSAILKNPEVLLADLVHDDGTPYVRKHPYSLYQDEEDFDNWGSFCQLVKYKDRYTVFINRENSERLIYLL